MAWAGVSPPQPNLIRLKSRLGPLLVLMLLGGPLGAAEPSGPSPTGSASRLATGPEPGLGAGSAADAAAGLALPALPATPFGPVTRPGPATPAPGGVPGAPAAPGAAAASDTHPGTEFELKPVGAATEAVPAAPVAWPPLGRPRVCVVLSGGGARGAAHIGVLKVLEALRVPVDCIAGTSMGSLVGGAYAGGMSTEAMKELVGTLSTQKLFRERPPRQDLSIRRKFDDHVNLFTPDIGVRSTGLLLPMGVVSGVRLETVLRELVQAQGYREFDKLPIPYRAVATDLVVGKPVIFARGELANVMRASMSVPGAVAPIEYAGHLLVDGGLTDNLPVEVARRELGADIIIAVNLGTPLMTREQLTSLIGVTGQMLNILTEQNVRASLAQLRPQDILIEPALGDFSAGNFDELQATIPIGEAAARKQAERLQTLALPPTQYAELRARQQLVREPDTRPVDEIRFAPMERVNPDFALATMRTRPGEPIDQQRLDTDMSRLFGTGDFQHVNYRFLEEPGRRILSVDAIEKSYGPNFLRFGLGLSSDFSGDAFFNLLGSYRRTWVNSLGAEWRTDVQVGQTSRLRSEFYQPLDVRQRFFVAPRIDLERRRLNIFQDSSQIAAYDLRSVTLGVDVGTQFSKYGELRLGVETGRERATLSFGPPTLAPDVPGMGRGAIVSRLFVDQLDSTTFPRSGYGGSARVYASQPGLGAEYAYVKGDLDATVVRSFGRHTFNLGVKAGSNIGGNELPRNDLFQWGGFLQQSGYSTGQLLGGNIQFARIVYYNQLVEQTFLEGVYAGMSLELGRVGAPLIPGNQQGLLKSAAVFLGLDSPIGPLYLGYGRASGGNYAFYLFLGRP